MGGAGDLVELSYVCSTAVLYRRRYLAKEDSPFSSFCPRESK